VDWINLTHDRGQYRALVQLIINYGIQQKGVSWLAKQLLDSQNGASYSWRYRSIVRASRRRGTIIDSLCSRQLVQKAHSCSDVLDRDIPGDHTKQRVHTSDAISSTASKSEAKHRTCQSNYKTRNKTETHFMCSLVSKCNAKATHS
jgi:hypothetical protein